MHRSAYFGHAGIQVPKTNSHSTMQWPCNTTPLNTMKRHGLSLQTRPRCLYACSTLSGLLTADHNPSMVQAGHTDNRRREMHHVIYKPKSAEPASAAAVAPITKRIPGEAPVLKLTSYTQPWHKQTQHKSMHCCNGRTCSASEWANAAELLLQRWCICSPLQHLKASTLCFVFCSARVTQLASCFVAVVAGCSALQLQPRTLMSRIWQQLLLLH